MLLLRWFKPSAWTVFGAYFLVSFWMWRNGGSGLRDWLLFTIALSMVMGVVFAWAAQQRERWVREAPLPQFLKRKLRQTYPHLSSKDAELVERGLRQFFLSCLRSNKKFVAMPSRAVDAMWHEFILHTKGYQEWCQYALGRFLHHTPAEVLGGRSKNNDGLRRAWYWACKDEGINPRVPSRLPLLFALDAKLQIVNGFTYIPNCSDIDRKNQNGGDGAGGSYCGTDFCDDSFAGDVDSFGGVDSHKNPNDGDASDSSAVDGCSGSGCGGGD
jgi:hypothetical protein